MNTSQANPPRHSDVARRFGCTVEQVRAQCARNAASLRAMEAKARRTGKRVGNKTAEELAGDAAFYERRAHDAD